MVPAAMDFCSLMDMFLSTSRLSSNLPMPLVWVVVFSCLRGLVAPSSRQSPYPQMSLVGVVVLSATASPIVVFPSVRGLVTVPIRQSSPTSPDMAWMGSKLFYSHCFLHSM